MLFVFLYLFGFLYKLAKSHNNTQLHPPKNVGRKIVIMRDKFLEDMQEKVEFEIFNIIVFFILHLF